MKQHYDNYLADQQRTLDKMFAEHEAHERHRLTTLPPSKITRNANTLQITGPKELLSKFIPQLTRLRITPVYQ